MLVYGDHPRTLAPQDLIRAIEASCDAATRRCGLARGDLLRDGSLKAAALAQGLADLEFEARGVDQRSPVQAASMALVTGLARALAANWRGGLDPAEGELGETIAELARQPLPEAIACKVPEGHAFYALYPETYFASAIGHRWGSPPLVIGLRSIGTGLAGAVAAVTGATEVITLRPTGHPFRRTLAVADEFADLVRRHAGPIAVVDEGPGLSGSSFGAAADWLEELGAGLERMVFMPSHAKPLGPKASARHRRRWAAARRLTISFEDLWRDDPPAAWFADVTGPADAVESLSAGQWRGGRDLPAQPDWERRKCLITATNGRYVAKFAGLGEFGEAKFERARSLFAAGFIPEPLALRRGFILQPWIEARPLDLAGEARSRFLAHLGGYLGFRARNFSAPSDQGATPTELIEMVRINAAELVPARAERLVGLASDLTRVTLRAVFVDGRLHPWEWLQTSDGRILKTDALDHACSHDLVGCQDIAWDVAGAIVEFDLTKDEAVQLSLRVGEAAGRAVDPLAIMAFETCYAAFQAAAWTMAADSRPGSAAQTRRYLSHLTAM